MTEYTEALFDGVGCDADDDGDFVVMRSSAHWPPTGDPDDWGAIRPMFEIHHDHDEFCWICDTSKEVIIVD